MNYDPYQAPANPYPQSSAGQLSQGAAQELLRSQGWVRFVSVLMLLSTAFMLFSAFLGMMTPRYSQFDSRYRSSSLDTMIGFQIGMFVAIALLYLYPAILLARYASAIKRFRFSGNMMDVEAALRHQRFFWRFIGIIGIVIIAIMIIAFLVGASSVMFNINRR